MTPWWQATDDEVARLGFAQSAARKDVRTQALRQRLSIVLVGMGWQGLHYRHSPQRCRCRWHQGGR